MEKQLQNDIISIDRLCVFILVVQKWFTRVFLKELCPFLILKMCH